MTVLPTARRYPEAHRPPSPGAAAVARPVPINQVLVSTALHCGSLLFHSPFSFFSHCLCSTFNTIFFAAFWVFPAFLRCPSLTFHSLFGGSLPFISVSLPCPHLSFSADDGMLLAEDQEGRDEALTKQQNAAAGGSGYGVDEPPAEALRVRVLRLLGKLGGRNKTIVDQVHFAAVPRSFAAIR